MGHLAVATVTMLLLVAATTWADDGQSEEGDYYDGEEEDYSEPDAHVVPSLASPVFPNAPSATIYPSREKRETRPDYAYMRPVPISTPIYVPVKPTRVVIIEASPTVAQPSDSVFPTSYPDLEGSIIIQPVDTIEATVPLIVSNVAEISPTRVNRPRVFIETGYKNFPPTINIRIPKLSWVAGHLYRMVIPENTFRDFEDGDTRHLRLVFKHSSGNVGYSSWIQFDPANQEIYALPLEENIGHYTFYLEAMDREGNSKTDTINIHVQQAKAARNYNHRITATFKLDKRADNEMMNMLDWQVKAVEKLAALYGDESSENINVRSINNNPHQITWTNVSLVDPRSQSCPEDELEDLLQVLVKDSVDMEPNSKAKKAFEWEFVIKDVKVDYLVNCENYGIVTSNEGTPLQPPQDVNCTTLTSQTIHVSWSSPPLETVQGVIKGYKVIYGSSELWYDEEQRDMKITNSTETHLHGLQKFTNYSLEVLVYTASNEGVRHNPIHCQTDQDIPDAPTRVKALVTSPESIIFVWLPPQHPNGIIIQYTVYYKEQGKQDNEAEQHKLPPTQLDFHAIGLTQEDDYVFWVTASTTIGEGERSQSVHLKPSDKVPAKIASFDEEFLVTYNKDVRLRCESVGIPTPDVSWTVNGEPFVPWNNNRFRLIYGSLLIREVSHDDAGEYTCHVENPYGADTITHTLLIQALPHPPEIQILSSTNSSIEVKLKSPILDYDTRPVHGYNIDYKPEFGEWESVQVPGPNQTYTLKDLWCGSQYQIYASAYNKIGLGRSSEIISAGTKGKKPQVPTIQQFVEVSSASIHLHLKAWGDGGCPIKFFAIEYKSRHQADWTLASDQVAPSDNYVIMELTPATWYSLRIRAHNNVGSSVAKYMVATLTDTGVPVRDCWVDVFQKVYPEGSTDFYHCKQYTCTNTKWEATGITSPGCDINQCEAALGMKSGDIPDHHITASSYYEEAVSAIYGRAHVNAGGGAWCPRRQVYQEEEEFLEVNLDTLHVLTKVEVQGRFANGQGGEFAEQFKLQYWRLALNDWSTYRDRDGNEILLGNNNTSLAVTSTLLPPIVASKVRFLPYSNYRPTTVCMRVEIYGCPYADYDGCWSPIIEKMVPYGVKFYYMCEELECKSNKTWERTGERLPNCQTNGCLAVVFQEVVPYGLTGYWKCEQMECMTDNTWQMTGFRMRDCPKGSMFCWNWITRQAIPVGSVMNYKQYAYNCTENDWEQTGPSGLNEGSMFCWDWSKIQKVPVGSIMNYKHYAYNCTENDWERTGLREFTESPWA